MSTSRNMQLIRSALRNGSYCDYAVLQDRLRRRMNKPMSRYGFKRALKALLSSGEVEAQTFVSLETGKPATHWRLVVAKGHR